MELTYSEIREFERKLETMLHQQRVILEGQQVILNQHETILLELSHLKHQGALLMATVADLKQNMQDLEGIAQQYLDFIIQKDALIAEKDAKIKELADKLAANEITVAEFQKGIDDAVSASQATEDKLRAGLPGVPPVGGTALALSYPSQADFSAAVAAYTGPEAVTLDGAEVKAGSSPSLDYFSHSADGSVSTSGPTD